MEIKLFDQNSEEYIKAGAKLLELSFPESYSENSMKEMEEILSKERITLMAVEENMLIGFIGGIPQYDKTGWELHPLVVGDSMRTKGVGTKLVKALEREIANRGGVMIYLGTDDERFQTSLSEGDLFEDTYEKIKSIKNYDYHPYEFYQKIGYKIVGILPDANGPGKPDIMMAKSLKNYINENIATEEGKPRFDNPSDNFSKDQREKLEAKISEIEDFSGVVSIKKGNTIIYHEAFGYADLSNKRKNNYETKFGIASGAKFFTALGIGKLIENGKLSFDDRLSSLTDLFTSFHPDVKIRHLLSHTSGIPDYFDEEVMEDFSELWIEQPMYLLRKTKDFLPLINKGKTMFEPGEKFHYNNGAYIVLGLIIEEVSGMDFTDFIERNVLEPAGLQQSGYFPMDKLPENTALGYLKNHQGELITNIYSVPVVGGPDGGIFVTAEDMSRLWNEIFSGQLLKKTTVDTFFDLAVKVNDPLYYGHGMWIVKKEGKVAKYFIMGEDPGVNFRSGFYPDGDWEVTVLCNRQYGADDLAIWIEDNLIL